MRGNEIIHQPPYLVEIKLGRRVRVHHGGVVDMLAIFVDQRANRQFLHIDIGSDQRRELGRLVSRDGVRGPAIQA